MAQAVAAPIKAIGGVLGLKNVFKTPSPPEAPKAITTETKAVQVAQAEAAQRRSKARGFQSTILSQPAGLQQTFGT
jgi:hypothetical protein